MINMDIIKMCKKYYRHNLYSPSIVLFSVSGVPPVYQTPKAANICFLFVCSCFFVVVFFVVVVVVVK